MHIDEGKKFDKRNIARNIRGGVITQKEYEIFLSKLPDVSSKLFNPEEAPSDSDQTESEEARETSLKRKAAKKKVKGKGK